MNYSSPFCPDDDKILTKDGKMKISKLYYKMKSESLEYEKIISKHKEKFRNVEGKIKEIKKSIEV